ncbi:MAG: hypothetical protein LBH81_00280 [Rickettsiales bacterium]|jgi:hypothetical protein|nr:hypothetical protein [Rickettsiales bacterium]
MKKRLILAIIFSCFVAIGARAETVLDCGENMYEFENMCIDSEQAYKIAGTECEMPAAESDISEIRLGIYEVGEDSVECVEVL